VLLSARQTVELFHLVFLRALAARGEDKSLFALKGGCNLRFFFGSVRHSEDIDLDVMVVAKATLSNKVTRLLAAPVVTAPLRARGVELVDVSTPKQTDTTQRWKAGLSTRGSPVYRTKIEFSRRDVIEGAAFEPLSTTTLSPLGLPSFLANHYQLPAAIAQKIRALSGRAETQARDVFDLHLLLSHRAAQTLRLSRADLEQRGDAIERAMSLSYDDYAATVVAYLEPEQAEPYASREAWDLMQARVVSQLEHLAARP